MSDTVAMVSALGGEMVTYYPYNGTAKMFLAIVERGTPDTTVERAGGYGYRTASRRVTFPRDAADGVLSIQEGQDQIEFPADDGGSETTTYTVTHIISQDSFFGGMYTVEVER